MAAVALAQLMNCAAPDTVKEPDGCGTCPSCKRIARGGRRRRPVDRAGRTGAIKDRSGARRIERAAYRPFEGRPPCRHRGRRRYGESGGGRKRAEDARGAAAASTFRHGDVPPGHVLPTVLSRCQQCDSGACHGGRPRYDARACVCVGDAHAAASLSDGSSGSRSPEAPRHSWMRVRRPRDCSKPWPHRTIPRRRLEGAKALTGAARGAAIGKNWRAGCALSSILRDLGALLSRADANAARERRSPDASSAAGSGRSTASVRFARFQRSTGRFRRRSERKPEGRRDGLAFQI